MSGRLERPTLWIALDVPSRREAEHVMRELEPHRHFKVGMQLFYREGPKWVRQLTRHGYKIFLDLKMLDIPNTVAAAVDQVSALGVELATVHVWGGLSMLTASRARSAGLALVGVSVLTSLGQPDVDQLGFHASVSTLVTQAVELARQAELAGLVVSGWEVASVRALWPQARLVVPGVRWAPETSMDQVRTVTPGQAWANGASDLVVGRPVVMARDRREAYQQVWRDIDAVERSRTAPGRSG